MDNKTIRITYYSKIMTLLFILACNAAMLGQNTANIFGTDTNKILEEGLNLINVPSPVFKPSKPIKLDAKAIADMGFEQVYENEPVEYITRDGKKLIAQKYAKQSTATVLLLHGVLSGSYLMNKTAGLIRDAADAEVIALDLRGHGQSEGKPGDVDFIDQYAYDLEDVIKSIHASKPAGKIILAGHSLGGGIILRHALLQGSTDVDGYILLAPLLGQNSPTIPQEQEYSNTDSSEPFMKIHISRIIGLKMLNSIGNHQHDSLPVLFFNVPELSPIKNYSYRANESMSPEDYKSGLQAVKKPLIVCVGSADEAFSAAEFEKAVSKNSKGETFMIESETHNGIRHNTEVMKIITNWVNKHNLTAE